MSLQPHEAHIPLVQQFMVDHNLHGMSFIDVADAAVRGIPPSVRAGEVMAVLDVVTVLVTKW